MIVKYRTMKGYHSPYVPGWDCHGLPIEHQVDKNLGSKKENTPVIEKRKLCREYAGKFVDIQREEFKSLGVFGDWDKPYITMDYAYEASIDREFHSFMQKGMCIKERSLFTGVPHALLHWQRLRLNTLTRNLLLFM